MNRQGPPHNLPLPSKLHSHSLRQQPYPSHFSFPHHPPPRSNHPPHPPQTRLQHSPRRAIATLKSEHGIQHFEIVIANAAICNFAGGAKDIPVSAMQEHFTPYNQHPQSLVTLSCNATPPHFSLPIQTSFILEF